VRAASAAFVVVLACGLASCSGGSDNGKVVRTGPSPAKEEASGLLTSDPAPLTVEDLNRLRRGSASRSVMQLLFWAQWGSYPDVVASYDPRVVSKLGSSAVLGAYAQLRAQLVASQPKILSESRSPRGTLVTVRLLSKSSPPQRQSFLLSHRTGRWMIEFDTLLEGGLTTWVVQQLEPGAVRASIRTLRAAQRLSQRYRLAAVQ
jgi:hypothetical protein